MNSLRATLRTILRFLRYPLCRHSETLTKTAGTRVYTECLRCSYQSKGVEIAGHDYASTKHSWEAISAAWAARPEAERTKLMPLVAIAPEPTVQIPLEILPDAQRIVITHEPTADFLRTSWGFTIAPILGNLAGHATATRRKPVVASNCKSCGRPKESTRPNSNKCRACDRKRKPRVAKLEYPQKKQRKPWNTPRKISVKSVRKTSRNPSSTRSKTA